MSNNTPAESKRWAVIGGGALGLTMAHRLAERGIDVTLMEAAPKLGGLASPWQMDVDGESIEWDRYYHVTLLSDAYLRRVLGELELESQINWVETKTGFFSGGQLYSMSNSVEFLKFPPLNLIEKIRLGSTIFLASKLKDWKKLEQIPVVDWLTRYSGRSVVEKVWRPLLRAKLGDAYRETSAAFIWAHINRMYSARRSGLKREMFGYVPGGYATVLEGWSQRLVELGVDIQTSTAVERVERVGDGLIVRSRAGDEQRFGNVVYTTPAPVIAGSCPQLSEDDLKRMQAIKYLGIVCASMLCKKPISHYYVTNITDDWVPLTGIIEMTNIVRPEELGGHSLIYLPKYIPADNELFDVPDEVLQERWLSTLEKMYPHFTRDDVAAFRISRTRNVMALPTLGYSTKLPSMQTSVPGVWAVNSAHILKGNLNVNETIQIAEGAIEGVLAPAIAASLDAHPRSSSPAVSHGTFDRELVARP